jgi:predicted nucleotidyltransferase
MVFDPAALCYNAFMKPSEALAAHRAELRELVGRYGLTRPRVFGSVLTGTDTDQSDLDLLVDATETTTLFTLARLEHAAQELLGVRVSVLTPGFLPAKFRDRVLERAEPL